MPQRLKLIVAYDGTSFSGWQSQASGNTIQDHLERAFKDVTGQQVRVHGAGRTDAGVHALAQCAHVDLPDRGLPTARWLSALNALLPPEIRVLQCRTTGPKFHARFSATGKVYKYRVWNAPILPPFERNRAWHVTAPLDKARIDATAQRFVGTHNFAGFAANRGTPVESSIRTIRTLGVRRAGALLTFEFDGDGFLYKMVRLIVGSLVRCGTGKESLVEIVTRLRSGEAHRARFVAPAEGLFLLRVRY
ncbi:MAG: tRNA pseudouridine(38-40) synthase TruA [Chthoniobacterales bacterium]